MGISVLTIGFPHAINTSLYDKLNFNFMRDIARVVGVMRAPMVADPKMRERLTELGGTVLLGDFDKFVAAETEKWGKVVKFAALKPE
jgi:hypothetical protein